MVAFRQTELRLLFSFVNGIEWISTNDGTNWVYLGVKTCEVFLCFVAIVRVRVCCVDFFVFFVLRHL